MNHETAVKHGKALLRRMKGKGWKLDVWENMGWHYAVYNGTLTVHASEYAMSKTTYFTLLGDEERGGGLGFWTENGPESSSEDPNEVVERQVAYALKVAKGHLAIVKKVEANIRSK